MSQSKVLHRQGRENLSEDDFGVILHILFASIMLEKLVTQYLDMKPTKPHGLFEDFQADFTQLQPAVVLKYGVVQTHLFSLWAESLPC